ncbi:hypothetical protein VIAE109791_18605 [Vibrio aestuarianus subsp. francensis]
MMIEFLCPFVAKEVVRHQMDNINAIINEPFQITGMHFVFWRTSRDRDFNVVLTCRV